MGWNKKKKKKSFLCAPSMTLATIEELKNLALAGRREGGEKKVHDMNKKANILLFHVGTWFSLKF